MTETMNRHTIHPVFVSILLVMAFALPALAASVQPDKPLPVYVVATDGQRIVGAITAFDDQGFEVKDATGDVRKVAWDKLSAKTVYQLHEKLLKAEDKMAWASLAERLMKFKDGGEWATKAEQRAGGQAAPSSAPNPAPQQPLPQSAAPQPVAAPVASGQWTDLLALADPDLDGVDGDWVRQDKTLLAPGVSLGRLALPAIPEGNYEYEVEFERIGGSDAVAVMFPVGKTQIAANLGWSNGGKNSLEFIDGKTLFSERTGQIMNNKHHRLLIRVETKGDSADIDTKLDGQTLIQWSGPLNKLKTHDGWKLPNLHAVGLGSQKSKVVFHSARIRMLSGNLDITPHETRVAKAAAPQLPKAAGRQVTALAVDKSGNLWVGTEGKGVWRLDGSDLNNQKWTHFTTKEGLGDDFAYAMAVDDMGRVWIGHLNHGVSVYNGKEWKNYDTIDGPIGERIFDISACPVGGDVWIATSAGISRYQLATDSWRHYTTSDGLPELQAQSVAFDTEGNIYIGTQSHGLATAKALDNYKTWVTISPNDVMTNSPAGNGLPSTLVNNVFVATNNAIYVTTPHGIGKSTDFGSSWTYLRGADWEDILKRSHSHSFSHRQAKQRLLKEDYITCINEDDNGQLWLGYRRLGYQAIDPKTGNDCYSPEGRSQRAFVTTILADPRYPLLIGTYGDGLLAAFHGKVRQRISRQQDLQAGDPAFPSPIAPPTFAQLVAMSTQLSRANMPFTNDSPVINIRDDWRTQGDWQGRQGKHWCCIAAIGSIHLNYYWGASGQQIDFIPFVGPHPRPDTLRHWVWDLYTDDRRALELPPLYIHSRVVMNYTTWSQNRRPAGIDDHAEAYPMNADGPHLYYSLAIPRGTYRLSFYLLNYDGQDGNNRYRDYYLTLKANPPGVRLRDVSYDDFVKQPTLCTSRIRDFWGGTYKQFLVRGPIDITIEQNKNCSFNTMASGFFIDLVDETASPYFLNEQDWSEYMRGLARAPTLALEHGRTLIPEPSNEVEAATNLLEHLERLRRTNPIAWTQESRSYYLTLLRWAVYQNAASPRILTILRSSAYYSGDYVRWEKSLNSLGMQSPRDIEKALRWDPDSPSQTGYDAITRYLNRAAN